MLGPNKIAIILTIKKNYKSLEHKSILKYVLIKLNKVVGDSQASTRPSDVHFAFSRLIAKLYFLFFSGHLGTEYSVDYWVCTFSWFLKFWL